MSAGNRVAPPPIARALLSLALPSGIAGEAIRGDLDEEFQGLCRTASVAEARAWYRRQVLHVVVGYRLTGYFDRSRRGAHDTRRAGGLSGALPTLRDDVSFAARRLAKSPVFTAVSVFTIAIAIGANTAMFSALDAVMFPDLPYPDADRIVQIWQTNPDYQAERGLPYDDFSLNALDYREYEGATTAFDRMGFALRYAEGTGTLEIGGGAPEKVVAWGVSPSFFEVLGMPPVLGRGFTEEETAPQGEMRWTPVAILSHDLWMSRFGGDPGVLGREVRFESAPTTVVGVLPADFEFPKLSFMGAVQAPDVDVYVPLYYQAFYQPQDPNRMRQFLVTARLREGVSREQADGDLRRVAAGLAEAYPETHAGWVPVAHPLREITGRGFRTALFSLMAVVGFVLLIACANVANLLVAQGTARRSEMAVRSAIGGGRSRLVQLLLTESLLLAGLGGLLGVALAHWGTRRLVQLMPSDVPGVSEAGLDAGVLLFALGLTLLTGIVFGLLPAVRASALSLVSDLRGGRGESGTRGEWRISRLLVAGQVAITVVLLAGAGVLGKSFLDLRGEPLGYEPENVLAAWGVLGAHHPYRGSVFGDSLQRQERARRARETRQLLEAIPGVASVASGRAPLLPRGGAFPVQFTESGEGPRDGTFRTGLNWVTPNYFELMGIPLLRGEGLAEFDGVNDWRDWWSTNCDGSYPLSCRVLVSETLAEQVWPGEDPLGKELGIYGCCWTVVGVVGDVRHKPLEQWWELRGRFDPDMQVYVRGGDTWLLRTGVDPLSITGAVRAALNEVDAEAVVEFDTLERLHAASLGRPRFFFLVFGMFAAVALLMSLVGLYGTIAYSVGRRTREIGVRMALGAARMNVRAMVVGQGMVPVLVGLVAGVGIAVVLVGVLESFLYGASPLDPWVMAGVVGLLASVAALACWAPARYASAVDPVRALTHE